MKYLILMAEDDHFARWDRADAQQRQRVHEDFGAFTRAVGERGRIVAGEALVHPEQAGTVLPGGRIADGPYAETTEQLGGFYLIDVPTRDDALALAALLPDEYSREVREVLEVGMD
ncbi:YciI family protein [Microlunatus sp. Gsoil 973]|uniref:YciI family protein n=1 Tax=Microlunatus sp. Gsoil 973 TaxID=2672569 RepID=UPI0012B44AAE|nr:YciI family protein [Microlunatus sp. Gsoil 973]QGN33082.1 transcription initiation protein [Microlunatus sp. Gsoil 973]